MRLAQSADADDNTVGSQPSRKRPRVLYQLPSEVMDRTAKDKVSAFESTWKANGNKLTVDNLRNVPWPLFHLYPSSVRTATYCVKDLADMVDELQSRQAMFDEVLKSISTYAQSLQTSNDLQSAIAFIRLEHKLETLDPSTVIPQRLRDKLVQEKE